MNYSQIILDYLFANEGVSQEYPLLKYLETEWPVFFSELVGPVSLYQKHFLLFYRLYLLDEELAEKNLRLLVSSLDIRIVSKDAGVASQDVSEMDALRAFYSNKNNLNLSEAEVQEMQRVFWEKYLALDQKAKALTIFNLQHEKKLNWALIKHRYKQMAQQHHPDKGGDSAFFLKLNEAYEQLKLLFK